MSKIEIYTDGGSSLIDDNWVGGWGTWCYPSEEGKNEYGVYGPGGVGCTNNAAELMAYKYALEEVLEGDYKEAHYYMDSKYVMDNCRGPLQKWKQNDFMTRMGTDVKNRELWEDIDKLQTQLDEKKVGYQYTWVKGHSGILGNEHADSAATEGKRLAQEGGKAGEKFRTEKSFYVSEPEEPATEDVPPTTDEKPADKKPKKEKVAPANAFLCFGKLLDISHRPQAMTVDGRTIYMNHAFSTKAKSGDDDEATKAKKIEAKTRNLGQIDPDAAEGLILAKEQCLQYAKLRQYQNEIAPRVADYPFVVDWAAFTSKARWEEFVRSGNQKFKKSNKNILSQDKKVMLTYYLDIPRLADDAVDSCMRKLDLLEQFEAGDLDDDLQDITDMFFEENAKGKTVPVKSTAFDRLILLDTEYEGKKLTVRLTQGIHMPQVSAFKRMFEQEKEIKIYFVKFTKTPVSFRHAIIVQGKDNLGIYNAPFSSLRLVP